MLRTESEKCCGLKHSNIGTLFGSVATLYVQLIQFSQVSLIHSVNRSYLPFTMSELVVASSVNDVDKWIERLYDCKPLTEVEVKSLCEQVNSQEFYYYLISI